MRYLVGAGGLALALLAVITTRGEGLWIGLGLLGLIVMFYYWPAIGASSDNGEVLRGTEFVPTAILKQKYNEHNPHQIFIGEIPIPRHLETYHFAIVGSIGTGKTLLMHHVMDVLSRRGTKAIIHDPKPDYFQAFFDPKKDKLFNPMDARSMQWNIFAEIETLYDIENICASIIPENPKDPHWSNAPRDVLAGAIQHLVEIGQQSNLALWDLAADAERLVETVRNKKLPGYQHLMNERHANDVISALAEHTRSLRYLATMDVSVEKSFSFKKYFSGPDSRFIFLTNFKKVQKALSPLLTLFIDVAGRHVLSEDDINEAQIFFILDEFKDLKRLDSLSDLIVQGRSKGASVWVGAQDVHQVDEVYGADRRATLLSSLSSHVIFRVGDPNTAKYFSQAIGEQQRRRWHQSTGSHSQGLQGGGSSETTSEHITTEAAVMASEISGMEQRHCIVRLMDTAPGRTYIPDGTWPENHAGFVENPVFRLRPKEPGEGLSGDSAGAASF